MIRSILVRLIGKVISMSLETVEIVPRLPRLGVEEGEVWLAPITTPRNESRTKA